MSGCAFLSSELTVEVGYSPSQVTPFLVARGRGGRRGHDGAPLRWLPHVVRRGAERTAPQRVLGRASRRWRQSAAREARALRGRAAAGEGAAAATHKQALCDTGRLVRRSVPPANLRARPDGYLCGRLARCRASRRWWRSAARGRALCKGKHARGRMRSRAGSADAGSRRRRGAPLREESAFGRGEMRTAHVRARCRPSRRGCRARPKGARSAGASRRKRVRCRCGAECPCAVGDSQETAPTRPRPPRARASTAGRPCSRRPPTAILVIILLNPVAPPQPRRVNRSATTGHAQEGARWGAQESRNQIRRARTASRGRAGSGH